MKYTLLVCAIHFTLLADGACIQEANAVSLGTQATICGDFIIYLRRVNSWFFGPNVGLAWLPTLPGAFITSWWFMLAAPQLAPRNMVLTSPSQNCVQMSYSTVQYPNAPLSQIVYQVNYISFSWFICYRKSFDILIQFFWLGFIGAANAYSKELELLNSRW